MTSKILIHKSSDNVDYNDPSQFATDDSLITRNAKSNTISKALRFLLKRNGERLLKRTESEKAEQTSSELEAEPSGGMQADPAHAHMTEIIPDDRTDDQVIKDACKDRPTKPCAWFVDFALKKTPEVKHKIALALKNKPDYVDGPKFLYHKLFESAIRDVEEKNIDDKLDLAVDLLLSINPATRTGMIVTKLARTALKPALNAQLDKSLATQDVKPPGLLKRTFSRRKT